MRTLVLELKQAWRAIVLRPGFSALAVGVLAAGLACVIYMLIAIGSLVLRPLPFPHADRLHHVGLHDGNDSGGSLEPLRSQDLLDLRRQLAGTAEVAGFMQATVNLSDLERPERFAGAFVSGNLFQVLGVAPALGRDFALADEQDGAAVVMLSHAVWVARYGADPGIVGRQVRVNTLPATVIGVMPQDFSYPDRETVWVPARFAGAGTGTDQEYRVVVRRTADASTAALDAAIAAWFADAARAQPAHFRHLAAAAQPLAWLAVNPGTRTVIGIMLASVLLVLLVACANAANLLLTRTLGRRQELAVRVALGASSRRLMLHLIAQSLLLTLAAVAIAIPLAHLGAAWTERMFAASEDGPPLWIHFTFDPQVIGMTAAVAVLTALAAGLLPALRAREAALAGDLRDGARGIAGGRFARISRVLVIGEVALSCALLIAVGTLAYGIAALDRTELGIDPSNILTARVGLFADAHPTGAEQTRVIERIVERLRADPAVIDATAGTNLPALGTQLREVLPERETAGDGPLPRTLYAAADDRYLAAYGLRLREGRFFDTRDAADGVPVAVVDARFADRMAAGGPVLGQRFRLNPREPSSPLLTVIGVVEGLTMSQPGTPVHPALLVPLRQQPARFVSLAVRVHGDPAAFAPRLSDLIRAVDADTPAYWVRTYAQTIREKTFTERLLAQVFGAFGAIALILAGAGLYGVMAFAVAQRTREIGVRRALGASAGSVLRDLATLTGTQLGIGLALGLALGIPFARVLAGALDSIEGGGVLVVLAVLLVLGLAAALAVAVPARRALRVDPMVALRHD